MQTTHIVITGRVQGVFFRSSLKSKADEFDVKGWVRNLADGTVEALLQGEDEEVKKIIEWCQFGPSGAQVQSVLATIPAPPSGNPIYQNFVILP